MIKLWKKITSWYNNLPSLEDHLAREACDELQKVEPIVRREAFTNLIKSYSESEPKMVKALEKHRKHLGVETMEDWR